MQIMKPVIVLSSILAISCIKGESTTTEQPQPICPGQRQKMFDCLTMLIETTEEQEWAMAKKALTEEAGMQALFLDQWDRNLKSFDKCRKLDANFDKCMPATIELPDYRNYSNYLLDKLDCVRSASQNIQVLEMKDNFITKMESTCFSNKTEDRSKDEPCRPSDTVQRCLAEENLAMTQDWLISQDKASVKLGKLFDESKKEKLSKWRCYECVFLVSDECKPTDKQHDCILSQKRRITETSEQLIKKCMENKGYKKTSDQIPPEMKMFAKGRLAPKTDFCAWLEDDIRFH